MKFIEAPLAGAFIVELDPRSDERGWFARTFDRDAFERRGLAAEILQESTSFNARRGTLRGMHFQAAPHEETKLVRCTRGAIYDVVVDLRPGSATFCRWHGVELTPDCGCALYVPKGMAHGFLTLADDSEVAYQMTAPHVPEQACGVRYDDPVFAIAWPQEPSVVSERDRSYPDFAPS